MTSATHIEIQAEDAREYVRTLGLDLLNDSPEVEIVGTPKWDADGSQHLAGRFVPTEITGCKAEARVSIPWPAVFSSADARAEAAAGFDEADRLPRHCLKAILEHTRPPGGAKEIEEAHELNWKLERMACSTYDSALELLTFPVTITGE